MSNPFPVGSKVRVIGGADKGREGIVYKIYITDSIPTVSVKFAENNYGMYNLYDIEAV